MKIGSHVGMSGKKMLVGAVEEALSYEANSFMIYTGAPQNTRRKPVEELNIEAGWALMKKNGFDEIIVHAPYIINLANTVKPATFELATEFLAKEIERSEALGARTIVLHPGAHVGAGEEAGLQRIVEGLDMVLHEDMKLTIALETMAGKGTELGRSFEELAYIIEHVKLSDKLSVCFDTCHVHDAGYDIVNDFDGVMAAFDRIVGKDRIAVFHINDSKNVRGAKKDRHENIGFGEIGWQALEYIVHHTDFTDVTKILETPYVPVPDTDKKNAPYWHEIAMLRSRVFDEMLKKKIVV
ncbi:MAG: deoxyribonuclease IV [Defluviitaleaceae bacterium]|nr:deoxyribonuclease IV [Defluviitaleaceae bacterium]